MVLDTSQIIKIYTTRLVNSLIPSDFGEEYIFSITNELLSLFNNSSTNVENIDKILDQYKRVFLSRGKNLEWIKFKNIIESLVTLKDSTQVGRYLMFLGCLKGLELDGSNDFGFVNLPHQPLAQPQPQVQSPINLTQIPSQVSSSHINRPRSQRPATKNRPIDLQSSPYRSQYHSQSQPQLSSEYNLGNNSLPTNYSNIVNDQLIKPYYETLDEAIILQYLSFTLTGLDSKIFHFIKNGSNLKIEIPKNINNSYSSLLSKILEPGLIYVKLTDFLNNKSSNNSSPIKTSFITVLTNELNNYSNFINELFALNPSSLIIVYNQIYEKILKLRLLYSLTNQLNLNGYEFLTTVFELTKFSDKIIYETSNDIFRGISKPYYEILENWILKGDLIDNNEEFFIEFDIHQADFHDIIKYLPEKVPNFFININKDIGFKIFQIGKILIFLNKYCKELKFINEYIKKYSNFIYQQHQDLQMMDINIINQLINNQYEELVNYFSFMMHNKYQILYHLKNFKKIYLMSTNDFIDAIIFKGFELFNEPSNQLTSNQLSKILVDSINFSSIKNYTNDMKNRLDARILDLSHGNIGWQVFTLEYRINDLPINHILNYGSNNLEYLKIFNFIWKLKQFQYYLNLNFKESNKLKKNELKKFYRSKKNLSNYRNLYILQSFKTINLIRHKLIKFLNLITEYLSNEIEMNFKNLMDFFYDGNRNHNGHHNLIIASDFTKLINSKSNYNLPEKSIIPSNIRCLNFNELINLNLTYIKNLKFKILDSNVMGKSGESIINQIYNMLEIIFKFIKSNEEFNNIIIHYVSLLNVEENITSTNHDISHDMGNSPNDEIDNELEYWELSLKKIVDKIYKEIFNDYIHGYNLLVKDLKSDLDLRDFAKLF